MCGLSSQDLRWNQTQRLNSHLGAANTGQRRPPNSALPHQPPAPPGSPFHTTCNSTLSPVAPRGQSRRPERTSGAKVKPPLHHLRLGRETPGPTQPSAHSLLRELGPSCLGRAGPRPDAQAAAPGWAPSRGPHLRRRTGAALSAPDPGAPGRPLPGSEDLRRRLQRWRCWLDETGSDRSQTPRKALELSPQPGVGGLGLSSPPPLALRTQPLPVPAESCVGGAPP